MKKIILSIIMVTICSLTMSAAHNIHYPTYTEDGITYVKSGAWTIVDVAIGRVDVWDILKVDKPNDRTIVIPCLSKINGENVHIGAIRENALAPCVSLDSLIISDGLYLSEETFIGCKPLEYLYYSSNTSAWGSKNKYSYYPGLSCKTLETVCGVWEDTFWENVTETLEKLIIRETSDGIFARLRDCKQLKTIICYSSNPPSTGTTKTVYSYSGTCGCEKFEDDQWSTITLYVPRESLEKYYFHRVWGEIDNIYALDEMNTNDAELASYNINETIQTTSVNEITITEIDNEWYTINGVKVDKPTKGIYVKNGKKYFFK